MNPSLVPILFGTTYCPEARAAFGAMTVQPSAALKRLYNTCIVSLIGAGIWAKLDALYLMNVETAQAARLNLKNPGTYDLTATSSPTFTAKVGYAGDGASAYLNTNLNPTTATTPNYVRDRAALFVWALKQGQDAGGATGQVSASQAFVYPHFTDDNVYYKINAGALTVANTDGRGLFLANRSAAGASQFYKNGASTGSSATASGAPGNANIAFLRDATAFYAGSVAMGGIGSSLSAQNSTDLYTALNTFKTGVDALP